MNKIILPIICFALLSNQVLANELLVVSGKNSKNSKKWQEEVSQEYSLSEMGKETPVKIVSIEGDKFPRWFMKAMEEGRIGQILGTPTFIIWDDVSKKELGRLEGYTQKEKFYSQLNEAFSQISQGLHPGRREGSGGSHQEEGSGSKQQREGSGGMSQDIMDHIYKTPEEAKRASEMLGLGGEIHSHETPQGIIYMPGPTM
ncbi:hypothetical protein [Zunongwangia profunda]|mgnify:FL=1|uniref:hypothetical protein n=1 Tax=Zunongwangia profunda TaxID=398743 RepID=UPI002356BD6A|nr:hypothetical protein [Zunongwangia profunda]